MKRQSLNTINAFVMGCLLFAGCEFNVCTDGHLYDEGVVKVVPSCNKKGVRVYTCTKCGNTKKEDIDVLEHIYEKQVSTVKQSCIDGVKETYVCTNCGNKKSQTYKASHHTFDEGTVLNEPSCLDAGVITYKCTKCDQTQVKRINATGHSYDEGVIVTDSDCEHEGSKLYTCSVCNDTYTESIEAKGHIYNGYTITKEPTCTENGIKSFVCTTCNSNKTEAINALGHSYDGIVCSTCGKSLVTLSSVGTTYIDIDGLKLTLKSFTHKQENGYNKYSISYSLTNETPGSEIAPGIFKVIYKNSDGTYGSSFQTGFFNNTYYGETQNRSYTWTLTSEKTFVVLEYMAGSQQSRFIFSDTPSAELYNWIIEE